MYYLLTKVDLPASTLPAIAIRKCEACFPSLSTEDIPPVVPSDVVVDVIVFIVDLTSVIFIKLSN